MGRISASAALPYPPELVWRVATRIEQLPRWMPEVVTAELLDPPLAVGSRVSSSERSSVRQRVRRPSAAG